MRYQEFPVHPILAADVQLIWSLEATAGDGTGPPMTILPDGIVELIFHYAAPFLMQHGDGPAIVQPQTLAVSQTRRPIRVSPRGHSGFLSVRFFPWGAHRYLPTPVHSFADDSVSATDLWGAQAHELEAALDDANEVVERVQLVQRFLLAQRREGSAFRATRAAIRSVVARRGTMRVRELAAEIGLGERQLERRFRSAVGTSPKHFTRICRFLHACRLLAGDPPVTLAQVAADAGFSDQPHLHHDFVAFSGMTPATFARDKGASFLEIA